MSELPDAPTSDQSTNRPELKAQVMGFVLDEIAYLRARAREIRRRPLPLETNAGDAGEESWRRDCDAAGRFLEEAAQLLEDRTKVAAS